jgi:flagellar hook protein FlgE
VNTVAFKAGRVTFKEGFAQLVKERDRPTSGGTNPMQVGLGSQIGSVETMFSQGNLESTGQNTDLAIQGIAFVVVKNGADSFYTRAGNFQVDSTGSLVSGVNGFAVQGRLAVDGKLTPGIGDLKIPFGQIAKATPTTKVHCPEISASATVFDKGRRRPRRSIRCSVPPANQNVQGRIDHRL